MEIQGVGPLLASAFVAIVADAHAFKSGRCLSAWIGLVPKQNSSGGKGEARPQSQLADPSTPRKRFVGIKAGQLAAMEAEFTALNEEFRHGAERCGLWSL